MKQAPKDDKEFFDNMSDQEFLRWMRNFADKLPAVLEDIGLPASAADGIKDRLQSFESAVSNENRAKLEAELAQFQVEVARGEVADPFHLPLMDDQKPS